MRTLPLLLALWGLPAAGLAQHLTIHTGTFRILGGSTAATPGDVTVAGMLDAIHGTVRLDGAAEQTLAADGQTFGTLLVDKAGGVVTLDGSIEVAGLLTLTRGDVDLGGFVIDLGTTGLLTEAPGHTIGGPRGAITATQTLAAPAAVDVGGLGAVLTAAADLGVTVVTRRHAPQPVGPGGSIARVFDIVPETNTGLDATLTYRYDESELAGLPEADLDLFRSDDDGATWTEAGGTLDTDANAITRAGLDAFSRWTAGPALPDVCPPAVFTETVDPAAAVVTATFQDPEGITQVAFRDEAGAPVLDNFTVAHVDVVPASASFTATSPYDWESGGTLPTEVRFQLQATASAATYFASATNGCGGVTLIDPPHGFGIDVMPEHYALEGNYPNPFNPETTIRFALPEATGVTLAVYDVLGRRVRVLLRGALEAGAHSVRWDGRDEANLSVASGLYVYRLETPRGVYSRSMLLRR